MDFYKGGKPLNDEERPNLEFAGSRGGRRPSFELTTLYPRIPATLTVMVSPGHNEDRRQRAVEEADRIEFVAVIEETKDIRTRLAPWDELEPHREALLTALFTHLRGTGVLGSPRNYGWRKEHSFACCALGCLGTKLHACWMLAPRRRRDKGKPAAKRGRKA